MGWLANRKQARTGLIDEPERENTTEPDGQAETGQSNDAPEERKKAGRLKGMALKLRPGKGKPQTGDAPAPAAAYVPEPREVVDPLLVISGVVRSFDVGSNKLQVLKGIDMTLRANSLIMLRGRSGSGKTTLLNLMGGLDQPDEGEILFQGKPFHTLNDENRTEARRKEIGFIFQSYALLPLLSAYENVELSLRMAGIPRSGWKTRVEHCLDLVGLAKRMHHRPFELSGGEQQRVAIAKSIAHRPVLLLADEPTAELDSQMGAQIMAVFREIIRQEQVTICMTTHDPTIMEVADHVYQMVDGRIQG
ncbi:ABC transporter ATP-binding protein [Paenibacillus mesotrionivorans]|uniref:ABC transporter ATP-binding protein n=1 Tax=Paenibacillus mesotrionivorans TaxID=3160968 RepID=A0ACC7P690_9BACL